MDLSQKLTKWIDKAGEKTPYDATLFDDLWRIRDIIEEKADHREYQIRLIERVESFERSETVDKLLVVLYKHFGIKKAKQGELF
jgi:hypothetical protein